MAKTKIDWADRVWNPVTGCTKVSKGCKNCYAERMHKRLEKIKNSGYCDGKPHFSIRLHPERLEEPLKWKKPQKIFVCSMGDLLHEDIPFRFIVDVFWEMQKNHHHTFLILTKRPEIMHYFMTEIRSTLTLRNVYLGVSVEDQQTADKRIPLLSQTPAAKRFLSLEPLLGNLSEIDLTGIDWVILGGETGPGARPLHPDWVRSVRDQCQAAGVPFFFKQWGEWVASESLRETCELQNNGTAKHQLHGDPNGHWFDNGQYAERVGKKAAGHLLDGKEYRGWPEVGCRI